MDLLTEGIEKWEKEIASAVQSAFQPGDLVIRRTGADRDRGASQSEVRSPKSEPRLVSFLETA
jgi:hypothetical protein